MQPEYRSWSIGSTRSRRSLWLRVVRDARPEDAACCGSTEGMLEVRGASATATIYLNDGGLHLPDMRLLTQHHPQYYNPYYAMLAPATGQTMAAFDIGTCYARAFLPSGDKVITNGLRRS